MSYTSELNLRSPTQVDMRIRLAFDGPQTPDECQIPEFAQQLDRLRARVPLQLFEFARVSGPTFSYRIETKDGRIWLQTFLFDVEDDPLITFDVELPWRVSEVLAHRDLRDRVVKLRAKYGLTLLQVIWP